MFIPDPGSDFYPSRIRTVSIPDFGSSSKNLNILTPKKAKKWFLSSKKYDPGCSSRIRVLTFSHAGSRIQGSKRHPIPDPDPQHCCCLSTFYLTYIYPAPLPSQRIRTVRYIQTVCGLEGLCVCVGGGGVVWSCFVQGGGIHGEALRAEHGTISG
jgi:hypothetical protein